MSNFDNNFVQTDDNQKIDKYPVDSEQFREIILKIFLILFLLILIIFIKSEFSEIENKRTINDIKILDPSDIQKIYIYNDSKEILTRINDNENIKIFMNIFQTTKEKNPNHPLTYERYFIKILYNLNEEIMFEVTFVKENEINVVYIELGNSFVNQDIGLWIKKNL